MDPDTDLDADGVVPMLRALAPHEEQPAGLALQSAMRRMRVRRGSVATVNEFLGAVATVIGGFTRLLGGDGPGGARHG